MAEFSAGDSKISADSATPDLKSEVAEQVAATEGGEGESEDDEEGDRDDAADAAGGAGKKKKKRKPKKKKSKAPHGTKLPECRKLAGFTDYYTKYGQTEPPTIPVAQLPAFSNKEFPIGEIQPHGQTKDVPADGGWQKRHTDAEAKEIERNLKPQLYEHVREYGCCLDHYSSILLLSY